MNAPERAQRWRFIIHSGVFTPLGTYARFMSGRFDRRQSPIELRRGPRFRSAFTGSHPLNCAPRSLVPGLGTHRCMHEVTLRGGRTGRSEARSAHRHAPHTGCPDPGPGPGSGPLLTQWGRIELGPDSRQRTCHCPPSTRAGKGGYWRQRPRRRLTHWPGRAWPWGSLRGLAGPLGVLEHRRTLCSCCVPMPKR